MTEKPRSSGGGDSRCRRSRQRQFTFSRFRRVKAALKASLSRYKFLVYVETKDAFFERTQNILVYETGGEFVYAQHALPSC